MVTPEPELHAALGSATWPRAPVESAAALSAIWHPEPPDLRDLQLQPAEGGREYGHRPGELICRHGHVTAIASAASLAFYGSTARFDELRDDFDRAFGAAVTFWLAARGLFPLHAAAVGRRGHGLLLLGWPGSGKSTAAWAGHRHGLDLLGDDTIFVRRTDAGFDIAGPPSLVVLPREIIPELPADATKDFLGSRNRDSRDRWGLPPTMVNRNWHRLVGIVAPHHGDDPDGALLPFDRGDLLRLAIGTYYASDDDVQLRSWFPQAAALSRLPAWQLHHTPELERRLPAAARWLNHAFDLAANPGDD